jgi:LysM repeat protein
VQKASVAATVGQYHVVQTGDTLSGISGKWGVSGNELCRPIDMRSNKPNKVGHQIKVDSGN